MGDAGMGMGAALAAVPDDWITDAERIANGGTSLVLVIMLGIAIYAIVWLIQERDKMRKGFEAALKERKKRITDLEELLETAKAERTTAEKRAETAEERAEKKAKEDAKAWADQTIKEIKEEHQAFQHAELEARNSGLERLIVAITKSEETMKRNVELLDRLDRRD